MRLTDNFALLNEPRVPWLDPESLKAKFLALSAQVHPDRLTEATGAERDAANQRFAELNAAYNCLRQHKERLKHLLELERGVKVEDVQRISPDAMDLFLEINRLCGEADAFLAEKARTASPLMKAQLFSRGVGLTDKLNAQLRLLDAKRDALIEQLKDLNTAWESAPVDSPARINVLPCGRIEHIYREFGYLTRWTEQLRDRLVQLSF